MYFKIYSHFKSLNIHLVDNGYRRLYIASRFWENFLTTSEPEREQKKMVANCCCCFLVKNSID